LTKPIIFNKVYSQAIKLIVRHIKDTLDYDYSVM